MAKEMECHICGARFSVEPGRSDRAAVCPSCGKPQRLPDAQDLALKAEIDALAVKKEPPAERPLRLATPSRPQPAEASASKVAPPSAGRDAAPAAAALEMRPGDAALHEICLAAAAAGAALALLSCFRAAWSVLLTTPAVTPAELADRLREWGQGLPSVIRSAVRGAGAPVVFEETSAAGLLVACVLLALLALRVVFRMARLVPERAADPAHRSGRGRPLAHALVATVLLLLVAAAAQTIREGAPFARYLVAWMATCFLLVGAAWGALARIGGAPLRPGGTAMMWNDAVFGLLGALALLSGGAPGVPASGFEQCLMLVLLNTLIAFAIEAPSFSGPGRSVGKALGFLAGCVIMVCVASLIFVAG